MSETTNPSPDRPPPRRTKLAPATADNIAAAASCLRAGGLVAMPTETVYGLAALATSDGAAAAIYAAKGRPSFNPLIVHFADMYSAAREARLDSRARKLAAAFWPGPLTIVAPVAETCRVSLLARAGLDTIAARVPGHPVALALILAARGPLAAPSANRSGRISPTRAEHVAADLDGRVDWILDAGPTAHGLESSIVACIGDSARLLRPGAITREALEVALGEPLLDEANGGPGAPIAPGALASHYAPRARLRLNATSAAPNEAALDFNGILAASADAAPGPVILGRPRRGGRESVRASARAGSERRVVDRGGADSATWPRRRDQRSVAPRRRAA